MKSFILTHKRTGIKIRYISEKRFKRYNRKYIVKPVDINIQYVFDHSTKSSNKIKLFDSYYFMHLYGEKNYTRLINLINEFGGELVFFHKSIKKTNRKKCLSKTNNRIRDFYYSPIFILEKSYSNCHVIFKSVTDYNLFKLSL